RIRHPGPALVEQDEPRESREPFVEVGQPGVLPPELEVRGEASDHDEIELTPPDYLICDRHVAGLRVLRLRRSRHRGNPSARSAKTFFWISVVPAAIVIPRESRSPRSHSPSATASAPRTSNASS